MATRDRQNTRGKYTHSTDRGSGMAIPQPINNGVVKKYQSPILSGNGEVPPCAVKGVVSRTKPLPGKPDNLA